MKVCVLVCAILIATGVVMPAQAGSVDDVRGQVQRLCEQGDNVSALHLAMKSMLQARQEYGTEDARTAACMIAVADVHKHRGQYHVAGVLYQKALSIQERAFGPQHPNVMHCQRELSDLGRTDQP
jgi:hypothetical protein